MAIGGFTYYNHQWASHADSQAGIETALNAAITWMDTWTNWSVATSLALYVGSGADSGWYWVMEHTSGARLVFVWSSWNGVGTLIHADNEVDGVTRNASVTYWGALWVAYVPASVAALGGGNPGSAGWLPAGSLKFARFGDNGNNSFTSLWTTGTHHWHAMVRGDEVILGFARDSHTSATLDSVFLGSNTLFTKLVHATDTSTRKAAGSLHLPAGTLLSETSFKRVQGLATDGNTTKILATEWYSEALGNLVNDRAPWAWSDVMTYASSLDLDTDGIIAGNGLKGTLNTELIRMCNSAVVEKQRLVSGNLVHIGNGLVLGYDSGNGAMV